MKRPFAALLVLLVPNLAFGDAAGDLGKAYSAFEAADYSRAAKIASKIPGAKLQNDDYRLYVLGQAHFASGDFRAANRAFLALGKKDGSRFKARAAWRIADTEWELKKYSSAALRYDRLAKKAGKKPVGDVGLARYRVARAAQRSGDNKRSLALYREFLRSYPLHPLAKDALGALTRGGQKLSHTDRLARAQRMTANKDWHESIAELEKIPGSAAASVRLRRDYWTAMTLFKMRRQYKRAGDMLLGMYKKMGGEAARALFHGARALSRADFDKEAITYYQKVVKLYPSTKWAAEAQYLSGWLEFNMGNYREGIPGLKKTLEKYGRSRWARLARWYLGLSHFLLGEYKEALPLFERLAKQGGRLKGGKGHYWHARTLQMLKKTGEAKAKYTSLVGRYPFSWYALLAQARLKEMGVSLSPLGAKPRNPKSAAAVTQKVDESLSKDPLIRKADELRRAGMNTAAGYELRRGESSFLKRHPKGKALAMLMDRYRKSGNFNRPWMLGVVRGGSRALNAPPKGRARVWWEHAYPLAYNDLVEKHRKNGKAPKYWLHSIMRKESGFDPHVHSYADARGLLQMIPATTKNVAASIGMPYTPDLLFDPEKNIQTGSWYIGRLFHKFRGQVPMAAGSFNSGPRPVMRWLEKFGKQPADVFVELCSYTQTREYMKKVTETYARYQYLYDGKVYEQPLTVRPDYVKDKLTY